MQEFFIGVDGGATKVIVSVYDGLGKQLGREQGGPANIRISVDEAWDSIHVTLKKIIAPLGISLSSKQSRIHVGMGLAGCEIPDAYHAFLSIPHHFDTLVVSSDSHVACLGAHHGKEGAIIVIGTGMVGFQLENNQPTKVSGWGFPHDDEGGGAWMGVKAMQVTFKYLDRRIPESLLAKTIFNYFSNNLNEMVTWANRAHSTLFAELAPLVIECAQRHCAFASNILQTAALSIDEVGHALLSRQSTKKPLPCALIGGLVPFVEPYLGNDLKSRLRPCQKTPDEGAILLVKQHLLGMAN